MVDAGVQQCGHHRRLPDAFGEPGAAWPGAEGAFQPVTECLELPDPVAERNGGQDRLHIAAAEKFHLAARHHVLQQCHVGRMTLEQLLQQPAREMHGETEARVAMQRAQERPVGFLVGLVHHFGEIACGLMGVDAEEQGDRSIHVGSGPRQEAVGGSASARSWCGRARENGISRRPVGGDASRIEGFTACG